MRGPQGKGGKVRPFGMGGLIGGVIPYIRRAGPFTPFSPGGLSFWYDAADLTTLFTTSAGSTNVAANNDPVGRWEDKSGNARHVTQGTAGFRPLWQSAGVNSKGSVLFDGTDDELLGTYSGWGSSSGTVFCVYRKPATGGTTIPLCTANVGAPGNGNYVRFTNNLSYARNLRSVRYDAVAGVPNDTTQHTYSWLSDSVNFVIALDGVQLGTTQAAAWEEPSAVLMGRTDASVFSNVHVAEALGYNKALGTGATAAVLTYLRTKWGTP